MTMITHLLVGNFHRLELVFVSGTISIMTGNLKSLPGERLAEPLLVEDFLRRR